MILSKDAGRGVILALYIPAEPCLWLQYQEAMSSEPSLLSKFAHVGYLLTPHVTPAFKEIPSFPSFQHWLDKVADATRLRGFCRGDDRVETCVVLRSALRSLLRRPLSRVTKKSSSHRCSCPLYKLPSEKPQHDAIWRPRCVLRCGLSHLLLCCRGGRDTAEMAVVMRS